MGAFEEVCALLPAGLRRGAEGLPEHVRSRGEELRLRAGRVPTVVVGREELPLPGCPAVTVRDLEETVERATRSSSHTALSSVRRGYFTTRGGHRIGLCGSAAEEEGVVRNLRKLSSLDLRVARSVPGRGAEVLPQLLVDGQFRGALLLGEPGSGKTTLLRDLVRLLSDGGSRVGLCDERGEVAALWEGVPQFDVGARTDVLDGCPKAWGLLSLLRGMSPQVLACDEITDPADLSALETCANCGVALLATVHAAGVEDLGRKGLYSSLLSRRLFPRAVVVSRLGDRVEDLPW